jgi:hypothetical protein
MVSANLRRVVAEMAEEYKAMESESYINYG